MKYSVVMKVLINTEEDQKMTQETIENIQVNSKDYELIIVDDGSKMGTKFLQDFAHTYIRHSTTRGTAISNNDGIATARGEYVAVVDGTIKVPEPHQVHGTWLDCLAYLFGEGYGEGFKTGIAAPYEISPDIRPGFLNPNSEGIFFENENDYPEACFMLRRDRFMDKFDESLPVGDYWQKAKAKGLKLMRAAFKIWNNERG